MTSCDSSSGNLSDVSDEDYQDFVPLKEDLEAHFDDTFIEDQVQGYREFKLAPHRLGK